MFWLHKWYVDAVSGEGAAFIGYAARARLWGVPVGYTGALVALNGQSASERVSRAPWPILSANTLHWDAPGLGMSGRWTAAAPAIGVPLLETRAGAIRWHCRLPRAQASLTIDGRPWRGVGYVEELSMTIAPWKLPFKTLRWGRFFSASHAVVWIDWRNGMDRTWVFHNAVADTGAQVRDDGLELAAGRLKWEPGGMPLRDARIADVAFGRARFLGKLLPNGWSRARETKFLARAAFDDGRTTEAGYSLHEVCTWH
jgi:hypothetical protein